jgi:hypothetical protein
MIFLYIYYSNRIESDGIEQALREAWEHDPAPPLSTPLHELMTCGS